MTNSVCPVIAIAGEAGSGKSSILMNYPKHEALMYINGEMLAQIPPYANEFKQNTMPTLEDLATLIRAGSEAPGIDLIAVDTMTGALAKMEHGSDLDGYDLWAVYSSAYNNALIVAGQAKKPVVMFYHLDKDGEPAVKASIKSTGAASMFTHWYVADVVSLDVASQLAENNPYLFVTDKDKELGDKHLIRVSRHKSLNKRTIKNKRGNWTHDGKNIIAIDPDIALIMHVDCPEHTPKYVHEYVQSKYKLGELT